MQDTLAVLIAITGILGGMFIFSRSGHLPKDPILGINFFVLGAVEIYMGAVYALALFGIIPQGVLPMFVRPGVFVICTVPLLISWRMGL